jgi:hypothetical protein
MMMEEAEVVMAGECTAPRCERQWVEVITLIGRRWKHMGLDDGALPPSLNTPAAPGICACLAWSAIVAKPGRIVSGDEGMTSIDCADLLLDQASI